MVDLAEVHYSPIILVKQAAGANARQAVSDVLKRFTVALRVVKPVSTRPPKDQHDEATYAPVTPSLFRILSEEGLTIAHAKMGRHPCAFVRMEINEVLQGKKRTFGIAVGNAASEAALRSGAYEVIPYDVRAPGKNSPGWDADRLAEFVYGLLDPGRKRRR